jgi:hypothetical protein
LLSAVTLGTAWNLGFIRVTAREDASRSKLLSAGYTNILILTCAWHKLIRNSRKKWKFNRSSQSHEEKIFHNKATKAAKTGPLNF